MTKIFDMGDFWIEFHQHQFGVIAATTSANIDINFDKPGNIVAVMCSFSSSVGARVDSIGIGIRQIVTDALFDILTMSSDIGVNLLVRNQAGGPESITGFLVAMIKK